MRCSRRRFDRCVTSPSGWFKSVIEKAAIPKDLISLCSEITEKVGPPRVYYVDRPFGYPLGEPNDAAGRKKIMPAAFGKAGA